MVIRELQSTRVKFKTTQNSLYHLKIHYSTINIYHNYTNITNFPHLSYILMSFPIQILKKHLIA